jgi:hypothetical protein
MTAHRSTEPKATMALPATAATTPAQSATVYLHVMPHSGHGNAPARWHVFQVSDASPRITPAATVTSWEEAHTLAARAKRPLRVAAQAWQQMRAAEVAPDDIPDDATLV